MPGLEPGISNPSVGLSFEVTEPSPALTTASGAQTSPAAHSGAACYRFSMFQNTGKAKGTMPWTLER